MTFYSFSFLALFAILSIFIGIVPVKFKNALLFVSGILFYSFGDISHLAILVLFCIFTYFAGMLTEKNRSKPLFAFFLVISFLPLFLYKYLTWLLSLAGITFTAVKSLPLGISFFTFQAVGYLIDVYRGKIKAERNFLSYGLFLSFFPQITAGPINSAEQLLPQINNPKKVSFEEYGNGLKNMAHGLFYKVFCSASCGYVVDLVFGNTEKTSSLFLIVTVFLYGFQIYWDFNGYTLMARGCAKCLGIEMAENFNHPYLSRSITEFWRRWHISLSTWFRKYLYFPLGGSRCGAFRASVNMLIVFAVSGIWHGADLTFLIWGLINGVFLVLEKRLNFADNGKNGRKRSVLGWIYTYLVVNAAWLFFRADSLKQAVNYIALIAKNIKASPLPSYFISTTPLIKLAFTALGIACTVFIDIYEEKKKSSFADIISAKKPLIRWIVYIILLVLPLCFGEYGNTSTFIYSRF
ncbi:MAG: MBOAT family protein [Clostridia bacterium]|nr:MBOAT family protein [Clostridia bacterium]